MSLLQTHLILSPNEEATLIQTINQTNRLKTFLAVRKQAKINATIQAQQYRHTYEKRKQKLVESQNEELERQRRREVRELTEMQGRHRGWAHANAIMERNKVYQEMRDERRVVLERICEERERMIVAAQFFDDELRRRTNNHEVYKRARKLANEYSSARLKKYLAHPYYRNADLIYPIRNSSKKHKSYQTVRVDGDETSGFTSAQMEVARLEAQRIIELAKEAENNHKSLLRGSTAERTLEIQRDSDQVLKTLEKLRQSEVQRKQKINTLIKAPVSSAKERELAFEELFNIAKSSESETSDPKPKDTAEQSKSISSVNPPGRSSYQPFSSFVAPPPHISKAADTESKLPKQSSDAPPSNHEQHSFARQPIEVIRIAPTTMNRPIDRNIFSDSTPSSLSTGGSSYYPSSNIYTTSSGSPYTSTSSRTFTLSSRSASTPLTTLSTPISSIGHRLPRFNLSTSKSHASSWDTPDSSRSSFLRSTDLRSTNWRSTDLTSTFSTSSSRGQYSSSTLDSSQLSDLTTPTTTFARSAMSTTQAGIISDFSTPSSLEGIMTPYTMNSRESLT